MGGVSEFDSPAGVILILLIFVIIAAVAFLVLRTPRTSRHDVKLNKKVVTFLDDLTDTAYAYAQTDPALSANIIQKIRRFKVEELQ